MISKFIKHARKFYAIINLELKQKMPKHRICKLNENIENADQTVEAV